MSTMIIKKLGNLAINSYHITSHNMYQLIIKNRCNSGTPWAMPKHLGKLKEIVEIKPGFPSKNSIYNYCRIVGNEGHYGVPFIKIRIDALPTKVPRIFGFPTHLSVHQNRSQPTGVGSCSWDLTRASKLAWRC